MYKTQYRFLHILAHLFLAWVALAAAFALRFDFSISPVDLRILHTALFIYPIVKVLIFFACNFYRRSLPQADLFDLLALVVANLGASLGAGLCAWWIFGPTFPRSIYLLDLMLTFLLTAGLQFALRFYREVLMGNLRSRGGLAPVLIYGAGAAGRTLVREIRNNPALRYRVVGFLDDDSGKRKASVLGLRVVGGGRDLKAILSRWAQRGVEIREIVVAMPSASGRQMRKAIAHCRAAGVTCKTVPGLSELLLGKVLSSQIREVSAGDLLGRAPVCLDEGLIRSEISGRSVMVTGGCGSIGSEICRQVARFEPGLLVVFDQSENGLFLLERDLRGAFPSLHMVCEVGDVRNLARLQEVMTRRAVDSVYHAGAYKHVPMMEANILEAVENNVGGTYKTALAAHRCGVRRFVMISTDKAVNPSSVMGLTKRAAELVVSAMPLDESSTRSTFVSVRFGNVLGSNGSVAPLFQRQIAEGGPVTVTHPDMRRYFMTIPEAVQLVLQASTMGKGSEVFVLDMGEPIRIVDLARNMIQLAGFVPDRDIKIQFTGMRPGEKLYEEINLEAEDILPTFHEKIKVFQSTGPNSETMQRWVADLLELIETRDEQRVLAHLVQIVPEYNPAEARKPADREVPQHIAAAVGV